MMSELDHVTFVLSQPMLALGSCKREHKVSAVRPLQLAYLFLVRDCPSLPCGRADT